MSSTPMATIVNTLQSTATSRLRRGTMIGWKNELGIEGSEFVTSATGTNVDDIDYLFDNMNTSRYKFSDVGIVEFSSILSDTSKFELMDYVALASVNWEAAQIESVTITVTTYRVEEDIDEDEILVEEIINIGTFDTSLYEDDQIFMATFDPVNVNRIQVQFNATDAEESVSIAILHAGKSFEMPDQPDEGFQPGILNSLDERFSLRTENNKFSAVTSFEKGTEEVYRFSFIPQEFMNDEWAPFIRDLKEGVLNPCFSMWNPTDFSNDIIFGKIDVQNATYQTRIHGSVSFTIIGIQ